MKLYMHPVSTTSRPLLLLIAEKDLPIETQVVDLMTGEHMQAEFGAINPNHLVPVLEDGDWRLTESQAILQFLADQFELYDLYPQDLRARARVNERLDWFNTQFFREYGYGFCYPQIFPHHVRQDDDAQTKTLAWGSERAKKALGILDGEYIGSGDWVAGDSMSIADLSGACMVNVGEVAQVDLSDYPNIQRWMANMRKLEHWDAANEVLYGFRDSVADKEFVAL